ncbi:MAG: penicillin-binding transpeptidase domain-containing protein [Candidatus Paceibacterota bacterium]|jgi:penicillin-binding protein 2
MNLPFKKKRKINSEIEPYEIFLDSKNLPDFDMQQFEGFIEKPIGKHNISFIGVCFVLVAIVFSWKLSILQIKKGEAYFSKSESNSLEKNPLFANRGIIYDRNKIELAWNVFGDKDEFPNRAYISDPGFSHILGYVSYPSKDKSGDYWQAEFIGRDGIEKQYNDALRGVNGAVLIETDVKGVTQSASTINPPIHGENITLSIDARLQKKLYESIASTVSAASFKGGTGVIMDISNGEVVALTNYPEYDSSVLSMGDDSKKINGYIHDSRKVFLNRAISGLYAPGSIVKPFVALGALNEKVIDSKTQILSTGSISVPNPYFPDKESVFNDWKAHGWVDLKEAIAVSSDVYFYEIGGGYKSQKGLGIMNIGKYTRFFGLDVETNIDLPGESTGSIPSPEWKIKHFDGDPWRVGDTYNTAIGQYGFQVTPIEMVRGIAALANNGVLVSPHVVENTFLPISQKINIDPSYFKIVKEGMRQTVTAGTATILNVPYVKIAAKTGTAQTGNRNQYMNSSVVGFFPYENPRYAFIILLDGASSKNTISASTTMRSMLDFMSTGTPEYFAISKQ